VPFFSWLLAQPEFADGRFHTTYLDEVLKTRQRPGRFVEAPPEIEDIAAIAAAMEAVLSPSALAADASGAPIATVSARRWRAQARAEGLR